MIRTLGVVQFLEEMQLLPGIDVRSPKEYAQGHIPGVRSMPLFSDEERAHVGTLYKQAGRDVAVLEGLRIVGPRLAELVAQARSITPEGRIAVHCWRGGERSGSVAWLLDKAGFEEVVVLREGYKAFRRHVLEELCKPLPLQVLGGYTGSGKTEVLRALREAGAQVIDLEGLACHKGSAFGALGQEPQPSTEQFENLLWSHVQGIDATRPLWVEDESLLIGRVCIPAPFFEQMRAAWLHFMEMSIEDRADRLVTDYGGFNKEELGAAVKRIEKRLGPQHCKAALAALEADDLRTVALITLRYYDKAYLRGAASRAPERSTHWPVRATELEGFAHRLIEHERNTRH